MIRCACGRQECKQQISFDHEGRVMFIYGPDKEGPASFKLDANATVQLITELRDYLISMTNEEIV